MNGLQTSRRFAQFLQQMAKLDDINHRILRELTRDGRMRNLDLADASACRPRPVCAGCRTWNARA